MACEKRNLIVLTIARSRGLRLSRFVRMGISPRLTIRPPLRMLCSSTYGSSFGATFFCYSQSMIPIVQDGDPVLREKASSVAPEEFGTHAFTDILTQMTEALDAQPDGVALAAPQIGISKRIFLVRYDRMKAPVENEVNIVAELGFYVNPEIIRKARKRSEMDEGCLSVRGKYGKTKRAERATVTALDEHGTSFERGGGGILAQAFQHEIDHLDGILFIDHATDIIDVETPDLPTKPRRQSGWLPPEDAHA